MTGAPKHISIIHLNNDCLRKIFSYLKLVDKMSFTTACNNCFDDVLMETSTGDDFRVMDCAKLLSFNEIKAGLLRYGHCIKHIRLFETIISENAKFYDLLELYCPNIEILELHHPIDSEFPIYERLLKATKHVKSVVVKFIETKSKRKRNKRGDFTVRPDGGSSIGEKLCSLLGNLSELQHLQLLDLNDVTGNDLSKLRNLIEFDVSLCRQFEPQHLIDVLKGNTLRTLGIAYCSKLKVDALSTLIQTQTKLEQLTISDTVLLDNFKIITQLKNLNSLNLYIYRGWYLPDLIDEFIRCGKCNDLLSLKIITTFAPFSGSTEILVPRLELFTNLKVLYLPNDDSIGDNDLEGIALKLSKLEKLWIRIEPQGNTTESGVVHIVKHLENLTDLIVHTQSKEFDAKLLESIVECKRQHNPNLLKIFWDWRYKDKSKAILKSKLYLDNLDILNVVPTKTQNKYEELLEWDDPFWG